MHLREFKNLGGVKHLQLFHSKRVVWSVTSMPFSIRASSAIWISFPASLEDLKIKHGDNSTVEPGMYFLERASLRPQDLVSRISIEAAITPRYVKT